MPAGVYCSTNMNWPEIRISILDRAYYNQTMDTNSRTTQLCIAGTQAEYARRLDDARRLYREAWDAAADDYDACVAAHYVAHLEQDPAQALRWNLEALSRAQRAPERTA